MADRKFRVNEGRTVWLGEKAYEAGKVVTLDAATARWMEEDGAVEPLQRHRDEEPEPPVAQSEESA